MNGRTVLDVSSLPVVGFKSRSPIWWAAICLVAIEGTMFFLLIATYFYVRLQLLEWPPAAHNQPGLFLPTLNVVILLVSCFPAYWASEAAKAGDIPATKKALWQNLILALVAFVIRIVDWRAFNFNWRSSIYGSVIWTIFGLHTFDYLGGVLTTVVLIWLIHRGVTGEKQRVGVDMDSITWYFLVGIWVFLYATVYIAPLLIGA